MKIAIIDDFADDSIIIAKYLRQYFQENFCLESVTIDQFEAGEQFLQLFTENAYELILIDYFMHKMNGLETARHIRQIDTSVFIIFITASRDFAIDCYKVHAADYIVKPPSYEQIAEAMSLINLSSLQERQFVQIACGRKQIKVFLKDIIYCDVCGHYVQIHMKGFQLLHSRVSFEKFAEALSPYPQFLLCYRGCLVNMDQIVRIENLDFLTSEGACIPIRQKEYARLIKIYHEYIFAKARSRI